MTEFNIQKLSPDDAVDFREIRLEGLRESPESFSASFEDEQNLALQYFEAFLIRDDIIGAFVTGRLVGVIGVSRLPGAKKRHVGSIWGLFIRSAARGQGLAKRLIDEAIRQTNSEVLTIQLKVESSNKTAIHLYETIGFRVWATEVGSLMINGSLRDAVLMRLDFDRT